MAGVRDSRDFDPTAHRGVYDDGPYEVELVSVSDASGSSCCLPRSKRRVAVDYEHPAPKPLIVALPVEEGEYPVVQFQHGYSLQSAFYTQLISHIASYGFIVVAPQMYSVVGSDATEEIEDAVAILNWMPTGLMAALPETLAGHRPNFKRVALVGHSRGGKVVFGLALGVRQSMHQYAAVVGLDPVDGMSIDSQTKPPILRFSEGSLHLGVPTLIVGTGLGPIKRNLLFPPCAPQGVSHRAFFFDIAAPAVHFVASKQGHMDFLNDDCKGATGKLSYCWCKNGKERRPMRRFAGGMVVAFLMAAFDGKTEALERAIESPELAPIPLERPEWKGNIVEAFMGRAALAAPELVHVNS